MTAFLQEELPADAASAFASRRLSVKTCNVYIYIYVRVSVSFCFCCYYDYGEQSKDNTEEAGMLSKCSPKQYQCGDEVLEPCY